MPSDISDRSVLVWEKADGERVSVVALVLVVLPPAATPPVLAASAGVAASAIDVKLARTPPGMRTRKPKPLSSACGVS